MSNVGKATADWLDHWVRPADVPERTRGAITERQVRRWISERRIPFCKPSGRSGPVMVRLDDLREFLENHTVKPS